MCGVSFPFNLNDFIQTSHEYGFSSLCVIMCDVNFPFSLNDFIQTSHEYGFSSLCVVMCCVNIPFCLYDFIQTSHEYGFTPSCIFIKLILIAKDFAQSLHDIDVVRGVMIYSSLVYIYMYVRTDCLVSVETCLHTMRDYMQIVVPFVHTLVVHKTITDYRSFKFCIHFTIAT